MNITQLLKQAIDLHVHIGPEIIPRKFTLPDLVEKEKNNLKGIGVKNHFFPSVSMVSKNAAKKSADFIIHSIVLNNFVGGFNADIIRASAKLTPLPMLVWFPTIHAQNVLKKQLYEIPSEWLSPEIRKSFVKRKTKDVTGLSVLNKTGLKIEVIQVLKAIKDTNAILATGHLSWKETVQLVKTATKKMGIKKIIITHPIYQKIDMPVSIQKKLAKQGAYIEHAYSMYAIDKIPIKKIVEQIKSVGADNCILTSDVGQAFSPAPSQALKKFISLLIQAGISLQELECMLIKNPQKLTK